MSRGRPIKGITIGETERVELEAMVRLRSLPPRVTTRAKIVLACARGEGTPAVAAKLGISVQTACKWRECFRKGGMSGLRDEIRSGRPPSIEEERIA